MKPKPKTQPVLCSNCGNPIGKTGVLMPTADPKKRQMCVGCANELIEADKTIEVPGCPKCGQGMVFTFAFPYREYACLPCGQVDKYFARNEKIEVSKKEHDKKKKLWRKDLEVLAWRLNGSGMSCSDCHKNISEGDCKTCHWGKEQAKNRDYKFEYYLKNK